MEIEQKDTLKTYKQCLVLCRRMIASEQYKTKEETIVRFLKNAKGQVLRRGAEYATVNSNRLYNILTRMEAQDGVY